MELKGTLMSRVEWYPLPTNYLSPYLYLGRQLVHRGELEPYSAQVCVAEHMKRLF